MKVLWTDFAIEALKEIYTYYKENVSLKVAKNIKSKIIDSTKQLRKFPKSGQIELHLEKLNEGHRYLVSGNFKVIYKEIKEGLLITDVFDCRQDPQKMNDEKRNLKD